MRLLMAVLLALPLPGFALLIDDTNIGISKMIPKAGDTITWQVPVVNDGDAAFEGEVVVTMRVRWEGQLRGETEEALQHLGAVVGVPVRAVRPMKLDPGKSEDVPFTWTPELNGYYRVVFELEGVDERISRRVAVTQHDTWFVWFGAPKRFKWCNVPTTVGDEDAAWWLRRGAIPAHWKCGVCCKDKSVDDFVSIWGAADWIAIDEVGGMDPTTEKFIGAWKRLKETKPDQFTAVWFMGAHPYWKDIKDVVDLFVPEIYLNYFGNHLGHFDRYFRTAREAGVMDQVIPGLGINEITDAQKRVTCSPTKADVLRQIRYLKRTAPELRGCGFFTSDSCAPGVAEYADELCEEYFVKPVITVVKPEGAFWVKQAEGETWWSVGATVRNVGGMDAQDVRVEVSVGTGDMLRIVSATTFDLPAGGEHEVWYYPVGIPGAKDMNCRIIPRAGYTVLDGDVWGTVVRLPEAVPEATALVYPPEAEPTYPPLPWIFPLPKAGPVELAYLRRMAEVEVAPLESGTCTTLPPRPGTTQVELATDAVPVTHEGSALIALPIPGPDAAPGPSHSLEGTVLTVSNEFYEAKLDLAKDTLESLATKGGSNLFREGWTLNAPGHEGFGEAKLQELPGALVVTIPYDSAQASGESQYVFFSYSAAIRIARSWVPKGEVEVEHASDRCGLPQAGGTYALQGGVGGSVSRGRLHDSSDYRDLLFGYLGGVPEPDNSDKAGWIDLSYAPGHGGGLGVAIEYRWEDSTYRPEVGYDVTRLYDGGDWIEVLHDWGQKQTFTKPQKSCVWLIPHGTRDFTDEAVTPPAQSLWRRLHAKQLAAIAE